jgi:hypothetical protein
VVDKSGRGRKAVFPPLDQALVKAVACELVVETKQPLSRPSLADVTARAQPALGKPISRSMVWRRLEADAMKPWRYTGSVKLTALLDTASARCGILGP